MSPRTGWIWVARALCVSAVSVLLGTGAHTLGGGAVAASDPFLLSGMALPLALAATRLRWSTGRAVAALGAGQLLVHALLGALHTPGGSAALAAAGHPAGSHARTHDLVVLALLRDGAQGHGGSLHALGTPAPGMVLAHVLAVLVAAVLLARAEDVLWRTLRRLLPEPTRPWAPGHRSPGAHLLSFAPRSTPVTSTRQRGPPPVAAT